MNLENLMHINDGYKAARILHTAVQLKIFESSRITSCRRTDWSPHTAPSSQCIC